MDEREIEGRTIDEAIERACAAFGVPREKLRIEILSEGTPGFLGLGAKKARVRAALLTIDMSFDAPLFRTDRKPPAASDERRETKTKPPAAAPRTTPRNPADPHQYQTKKGAPAAKSAHPEESRLEFARTEASHAGTTAIPAISTEKPVASGPSAFPRHEMDERAAERARSILEGLLARMQIESPVSVEETEEEIVLNIRGDGSGLIIGKRGQNLDAIQYFVNKAVHHSANGNKRIVIDTEEYRKRREESLVALALRMGEKAKQMKKPVTVGHLNAHDRRIVHLAVRNDPTLTTKSRGEGEYRKILILPARRGPEQANA
jgi:spoIIIJ-associated protein